MTLGNMGRKAGVIVAQETKVDVQKSPMWTALYAINESIGTCDSIFEAKGGARPAVFSPTSPQAFAWLSNLPVTKKSLSRVVVALKRDCMPNCTDGLDGGKQAMKNWMN